MQSAPRKLTSTRGRGGSPAEATEDSSRGECCRYGFTPGRCVHHWGVVRGTGPEVATAPYLLGPSANSFANGGRPSSDSEAVYDLVNNY